MRRGAALLFAAGLAGPSLAGAPAELAPGAPELVAAQQRLEALLTTAEATRRATARLQAGWTGRPTPAEPCADAARLELGWRVERFGAAWREASQAARVQAERVRRVRGASTVAPLVDARWSAELDALAARAERDRRALLEASAWQAAWVRPALAACPVVEAAPAPGIAMLETPVRGEEDTPVAVLGLGDGWVCPGAIRAEGAVVLVLGEACWSASATCGCAPSPVDPGAVLGAAVPEPAGAPTPEPVGAATDADATPPPE